MDFSALPDLGARDVFDLIVVGILLISGIFAFSAVLSTKPCR